MAARQDAKSYSLEFAKLVDPFLKLGSPGVESESTARFWRRLAMQPEEASSYLACLIARLISLDCAHGKRPLTEVMLDLFSRHMLRQDREEFVRWHAEWVKQDSSLPTALVDTAVGMQMIILNTMHFIAMFYQPCCPKVPRPIYLRWEWARRFDRDIERQVFKMISQETHWLNRQLVNNEEYIEELVALCRSGFVRGRLTLCMPMQSSLTNHLKVASSQQFAQLHHALRTASTDENEEQTSLPLAEKCVHTILDLFSMVHRDKTEERLLPLLSMLTQLSLMTPALNVGALYDAYRALQPFYLWPQPYCEVVKDALDFVHFEMRAPGVHFRRYLLAEQALSLPTSEPPFPIEEESLHIIVDSSSPRAEHFMSAFEEQEEEDMTNTQMMHKLILHVFFSFYGKDPNFDLTALDADLEHYPEESLADLCMKCLGACEEQTSAGNAEEARSSLGRKLQEIRLTIAQCRLRGDRQPASSSSSNRVNVQEVYAVKAQPLLWLPSTRPFQLHELDEGHNDVSGAESVLQHILTQQQGQKHRGSLPRQHSQSTGDTDEITHGPRMKLKRQAVSDHTLDRSQSVRKARERVGLESADEELRAETHSSAENPDVSGSATSKTSADSGLSESPSQPTDSWQSDDKTLRKEVDVSLLHDYNEGRSDGNSTSSADTITDEQRAKTPSSSPDNEGKAAKKEDLTSPPVKGTPVPLVNLEHVDTPDSGTDDSVVSGNFRDRSCTAPSRQPQAKHVPSLSPIKPSKSLEFVNDDNDKSDSLSCHSALERTPETARRPLRVSEMDPTEANRAVEALLASQARNVADSSASNRLGMHKSRSKKKKAALVKVLFAGDDRTVRVIAQAYVQLRQKLSFLFEGVDLRFYYVPLSAACGGGGLVDTVPPTVAGIPAISKRYSQLSMSGSVTSLTSVESGPPGEADPAGGMDERPYAGGDVWFGRFLGHLDGWYERNLMLMVHGCLRVLPQQSSSSDVICVHETTEDEAERQVVTPSKLIREAVFNYVRFSQYEVQCRLYEAEVKYASGKSEIFIFLQRLELVIPQKSKKAPELGLRLYKVGLDEVLQSNVNLTPARYWGLRLSNLPHPRDIYPANPESVGMELTLFDSSSARSGSVFKKTLRGREEGQSYHVAQVDGWTSHQKETFQLAIDTDIRCHNLVSFSVRPCVDKNTAASTGIPRTMSAAGRKVSPKFRGTLYTGSPNMHRRSKRLSSVSFDQPGDLFLPVMTFWPPNL